MSSKGKHDVNAGALYGGGNSYRLLLERAAEQNAKRVPQPAQPTTELSRKLQNNIAKEKEQKRLAEEKMKAASRPGYLQFPQRPVKPAPHPGVSVRAELQQRPVVAKEIREVRKNANIPQPPQAGPPETHPQRPAATKFQPSSQPQPRPELKLTAPKSTAQKQRSRLPGSHGKNVQAYQLKPRRTRSRSPDRADPPHPSRRERSRDQQRGRPHTRDLDAPTPNLYHRQMTAWRRGRQPSRTPSPPANPHDKKPYPETDTWIRRNHRGDPIFGKPYRQYSKLRDEYPDARPMRSDADPDIRAHIRSDMKSDNSKVRPRSAFVTTSSSSSTRPPSQAVSASAAPQASRAAPKTAAAPTPKQRDAPSAEMPAAKRPRTNGGSAFANLMSAIRNPEDEPSPAKDRIKMAREAEARRNASITAVRNQLDTIKAPPKSLDTIRKAKLQKEQAKKAQRGVNQQQAAEALRRDALGDVTNSRAQMFRGPDDRTYKGDDLYVLRQTKKNLKLIRLHPDATDAEWNEFRIARRNEDVSRTFSVAFEVEARCMGKQGAI